MKIIEITDIGRPEVAVFASLTEAQLKNNSGFESGLFIAESPKVINVALNRGYEPVAVLCERRHIEGDAAEIISRCGDIPVYTGDRAVLSSLTGYTLTRGVLCAMKRKKLRSVAEIAENGRLICVLQSVTDTTNIGAIFRSASALNVDGVILSADTCDPLNRRAVRVSMGTVFTVPWSVSADPLAELSASGYKTAALALSKDAINLDCDVLKEIERLAVVFGTEGDGLPMKVITSADYVVTIPMFHDVDSLNVAAAAAVTFWELRKR
ncbi:MAG: RNA methyltransferase [Muribaculaceae bacterium]|nr:RNA methyltransferase [Muribaculaceae bacterium]